MTAPEETPIWFGIGCYSFEAPGEDLLLMQNRMGTYTVHSWAGDVEAALRMIPSIDKINLSGFHLVRGDHKSTWRDDFAMFLRETSTDGGLHEGGDLRPHPSSGRIEFTVIIPEHVQRSVLPQAQVYNGTVFDVDIRYGGGMPVAFVRNVDVASDAANDPALGVAIVRQFLVAEFEQRVNAKSPIRFTFLGPSPMWTQCAVLAPNEEAEEELAVTHHDAVRYSFAAFRLKKSAQVSTTADAYRVVKDELEESLGEYYDLVSRSAALDKHQRFIEFSLEALVEVHRARGIRAWTKRLFQGNTHVNDLMLEVLAADVERERVEAFAERGWPGDVAQSAFGDLWRTESSGRSHADHVKAVADLLGARQSRSTELVTVFGASLLGGVAGAALTALVQALAG
ncbi:hypothetical protein [Microbacterium flavum]|uniref:ApeA N-terminal domain-containing protein n=1 Tax=Microbacterium flavum TaxID=415216 RepID=A0ABS5XUX0_9MICO|nr:hypothetical protein [Microbacterium flavum]MBT8798314.1 hypothetical protein [Microbacterium flavum]